MVFEYSAKLGLGWYDVESVYPLVPGVSVWVPAKGHYYDVLRVRMEHDCAEVVLSEVPSDLF